MAKTEDGQDIIVKFAESYNKEAHHLLAEKGLAPRLLHAEPIYPGSSFVLVVMEFVDAPTMAHLSHYQKLTPQLAETVLRSVSDALNTLHAENLVFADLRTPNILVHNGKGLLIDFDWCGREGEGRYPMWINKDQAIQWHEEVRSGAILKKEHDKHMFKLLLGYAGISYEAFERAF